MRETGHECKLFHVDMFGAPRLMEAVQVGDAVPLVCHLAFWDTATWCISKSRRLGYTRIFKTPRSAGRYKWASWDGHRYNANGRVQGMAAWSMSSNIVSAACRSTRFVVDLHIEPFCIRLTSTGRRLHRTHMSGSLQRHRPSQHPPSSQARTNARLHDHVRHVQPRIDIHPPVSSTTFQHGRIKV